MTDRVTTTELQRIVARINRITGSPETPWVRDDAGNPRANIGNYHLDGAYGGYALHRMTNESGGADDIFRVGHVSKRQLRDLMFAFIDGLHAAGMEG